MSKYVITKGHGTPSLFVVLSEGPKTYMGGRWSSYDKKFSADRWGGKTRIFKEEVIATFETEEAAHAAMAASESAEAAHKPAVDASFEAYQAALTVYREAQSACHNAQIAAIKECAQ